MLSNPAASVRVVEHDTIGSTNADALQRARSGERGPLWITARRQTEGRGRRGRSWVSEAGNLHATLLLTDAAPADRAAELSFVAALGVHDAVASAFPDAAARVTLKWPNDCLIDGCKFAGILIEAESRALAVGIGVNCLHHPRETAFCATDLASAGLHIAPSELLTMLSRALIGRIVQWDRGAGFAVTRSDWLKRAFNVGAAVKVAMPEGERQGRFETLDDSGRMVLRGADGQVEIVTAGDVLPVAAEV